LQILSKAIKEAKRQHYCRLIAKLNNHIKTTRKNIIKQGTGTLHLTEQIPSLLINDEKVMNPEEIAGAFNTFFLTIAENLNLLASNKMEFI
jgi:aspartate aminotransferase-like enzyme